MTLLLLLIMSFHNLGCMVHAQNINFGVYFDTTNGLPNPFGDGFYPQPQKYWSQVSQASFPIFLDWAKYLADPSKWNKGNQCQDRSSASYSTSHYQSPIKLQSDNTCIDRHRTRVLDPGVCAKDEARFYTTPYGLGVDTTKCSRYWWYDHSRNPDPWYLQEIRVTTPSEHTVLQGSTEIKYAGELQLAFKGSVDHKAKIAITGVFLAVNPNTSKGDAELEKLLVGWEAYQNNVYLTCKKSYNHQTCSLVPASSPVLPLTKPASAPQIKPVKPAPKPASPPQTKPAKPAPKLAPAPQTKPVKPAPQPISTPQIPPVQPAPKPVMPVPFPRNPSPTQGTLSTKKPKRRKLEECWTGGGCPGSYYCFPELFWQAFDGSSSHHHWRYDGSLTYPPCTENVEWRVMFGPLLISQAQLDRINILIYKHLDPVRCTLTTVGSPRSSASGNTNVTASASSCPCCVNANRMSQSLSKQMNLQKCDAWAASGTIENTTATSSGAPMFPPPSSTTMHKTRRKRYPKTR